MVDVVSDWPAPKSYWEQIDGIIPLIENKDYQDNNVILTIQKLLWNEILFEDFPWIDEFLLLSTYLKEREFISTPF